MFAKRHPRLELKPAEHTIYENLLLDPRTNWEQFHRSKIVHRSLVRKAIIRERLHYISNGKPTTLFIPEYQLVNRWKHYTNLSPVEADYFAAKLLGKEPVIHQIDPTNIASSLICRNARSDGWISPCRDWKLAKKLRDMFRIEVEHLDRNVYVAEKNMYVVTEQSTCEAIVYAALAREAPYLIDYDDQAYRGHNNADQPIYRRDTKGNAQGAREHSPSDSDIPKIKTSSTRPKKKSPPSHRET